MVSSFLTSLVFGISLAEDKSGKNLLYDQSFFWEKNFVGSFNCVLIILTALFIIDYFFWKVNYMDQTIRICISRGVFVLFVQVKFGKRFS